MVLSLVLFARTILDGLLYTIVELIWKLIQSRIVPTLVLVDIFFGFGDSRYFKRFYTYKKINCIFLTFDHSLTKNHRNRLNHCCRKTRFKNITNLQRNRLGPP